MGNAEPTVAQDNVVTDVVPDGMAIGPATSTAGTCQVTGQVVVIEDWPSGVDFRSATVTQGSFDAEAMVWRVGTLVGGTSARLVLYGEVRSEGGLVNQVGVTAPGVADAVSPNNLAAAELRRAPGLAATGGPALGAALAGLLLTGAGALLLARRRRGDA